MIERAFFTGATCLFGTMFGAALTGQDFPAAIAAGALALLMTYMALRPHPVWVVWQRWQDDPEPYVTAVDTEEAAEALLYDCILEFDPELAKVMLELSTDELGRRCLSYGDTDSGYYTQAIQVRL